MKTKNKLVALVFLLIFINLVLWNLFVPVFELPSEQIYFDRIHYIATHNQLPDLSKLQPGAIAWPDLYPLLMTPIFKILKPPLVYNHETKQLATNYLTGGQSIRGKYNRFDHKLAEKKFNWDSFYWSVHLARFITSLFTIAALYYIYKTSNQIAPLILAGFSPKLIHRSASLVSIPLLFFLFSLFYYLSLARQPSFKNSFVLGLITGLALTTKITGINLGLFFAVYLLLFIPIWSKRFQHGLCFTFGFLFTSSWYLIRNTILYHHPLALNQALRLGAGLHSQDIIPSIGVFNYWFSVIETTFITFWDGFGWENIYLGKAYQLTIILLLTLSLWGLRYLKLTKKFKYLIFTLSIFIILFFRANYIFYTPQGKDFLPLMLPISTLIITGFKAWQTHKFKIKNNPIFLLSLIAVSTLFLSKTLIINFSKTLTLNFLLPVILDAIIFYVLFRIIFHFQGSTLRLNKFIIICLLLFNVIVLFKLVVPATWGQKNVFPTQYYQLKNYQDQNLSQRLKLIN